MRTIALALAASMVLLSTPSFAQTHSERDECLLTAQNCSAQADDIQKRVRKLNKEIKKGTRVYSTEELKKLQDKLQETEDLLKKMEQSGGS